MVVRFSFRRPRGLRFGIICRPDRLTSEIRAVILCYDMAWSASSVHLFKDARNIQALVYIVKLACKVGL
jgi:hypothetical protein